MNVASIAVILTIATRAAEAVIQGRCRAMCIIGAINAQIAGD